MFVSLRFVSARFLMLLFFLLFINACASMQTPETINGEDSPAEQEAMTETPEYQLLSAVLLNAIIPWHANLEQDLQRLHESSQRFCLSTTSQAYESLKQDWLAAMQSWSRVGVFNFGAIDDLNIAWKFQFWPDPLNYVHRKFKSRLAGTNPAITEEELAKASVAIQGLSALEYLIYDADAGGLRAYQTAAHKCKILMATTSNLAQQGQILAEAWNTNYKQAWLNPVVENSPQTAARHYLETILNGLLTNLSLLKDRKLGAPLGFKQDAQNQLIKTGRINLKRLEGWRSESSLLHIESNLISMQALYLLPKGFSWYLAQEARNDLLDKSIKDLFVQIFAQLDAMQEGAQKQTAEQQIRANNTQKLEALYFDVQALFVALRFDYMNALNLHYRFNSHDGD